MMDYTIYSIEITIFGKNTESIKNEMHTLPLMIIRLKTSDVQ